MANSKYVDKDGRDWLRQGLFAAAMRVAGATALTFAGISGCATPPLPPPVAIETDRTVLDLRAKNAGYTRRVEELENRVLILEDQFESSRARAAERERPPVRTAIRILPTPEPVEVISSVAPRLRSSWRMRDQASDQARDDGHARAGAAIGNGGSSVVSEQDVEYAGDALSYADSPARSRRRARLHLSGADRDDAVQLASSSPQSSPLLASSGGKKMRLYRRALTSMHAGRYQAAANGFGKFLAKHPRSKAAGKAQFWLAQCHYKRQDFAAAEPAFRLVIEKYPHARKVPDAMLKLGLTLLAEGEADSGRRVLSSLARAYPGRKAARLAVARLDLPSEAPSRTETRVLGTMVGPVVASSTETRPRDGL